MSLFFINRPIFAWVIAISIMLAGVIAIPHLPVSRYPNVQSPTVEIDASYPGASAQTLEDSVTQIIEQNMTGLDGLTYMASNSSDNGNTSVVLTFAVGVNPDTAQMQVQNRMQQATPLLPQIVQQQGVSVSKGTGDFQAVLAFVSDGRISLDDLSDYVATNVYEPLSRVPGVGTVSLFGSKHAMRIWLDPDRLHAYGLTPGDVTAAVQAQNAQVSIGQMGAIPSVPGQQLNATVTAMGRFSTAEQFRNIILRAGNGNGATLRLGDVARVAMGQASYGQISRYNGKLAVGLGVSLASGANALQMMNNVRAMMDVLKPRMPPGVRVETPYDVTPFVYVSIRGVIETLIEAIVLVFAVMYLFLQNFRATLIPSIAVPVVLLGTFAVMAATGMSINMLTLFGVVLAIGLLVDDAIVVVENVERLISEQGLSPREATIRSMRQITSVLIGIASVLSAVFVPMSFLQGSAGVIYRQFSVTIVAAMVLSVLVAIVLTPALCVTLLKPVSKEKYRSEGRFFRWFNSNFERSCLLHRKMVGYMLAKPLRFGLIYLVLVGAMIVLFLRLPTAFIPAEDQGFLVVAAKAPVGATRARVEKVMQQVEDIFLHQEKDATDGIFAISGADSQQNSSIAYVHLKDWSERRSERLGITALQDRIGDTLSKIKDAQVFVFEPPPIPDLGDSAGFDFYLQDNFGQGHTALMAAQTQVLAAAATSKLLTQVRPDGDDDTPQLHLDIDAQKAVSLGLSMSDVNDALSLAWGGRYIDDFIDQGRIKHVIIQGDAPFRMSPEDFGRWYLRNSNGQMVSVDSIANMHWDNGPPSLVRYNGVSAVEISGQAASGVSSGAAMKEVENLVAKLPPGFSADFTGLAYQERAAGAQTPLLYAMSVIVMFLWLAALYESWSIPAAVLVVMPLGIVGAVLATSLRGMERDVYFQVAVLTTVGLTSKNAILFVEFAKENIERGLSPVEAALRAMHDRLRPILMTSLAFGFGVLPLAVATGAGAGAQRAIGTGIFGGMLAGTFLGIFFIPLFFVVIQRLFHSVAETPPAGLVGDQVNAG
jgi:multidrug efflux pump